QGAAVVLAQHRLHLLIAPRLRRRGDGEKAVEAPVARSRRNEPRSAEGTQEWRGPDDLERIVREADEGALANEGEDPGVLVAAEVEGRIGLRMVDRNGVENPAGEGIGVVGHRLLADPGRPEVPSDPRH